MNILIWDAQEPYPAGEGITALWRSFAAGELPHTVSIPRLIEENSDVLRARYLAWVYELGELRLQGRRVIDHLQQRPSFSYWWTTLLVEKCNYSKSPLINDAIRVLAFIDWVTGRPVARVTLASSNQPLAECLRLWCKQSGLAFDWKQLPKRAEPLSLLRRAYEALPRQLRALVWLAHHLIARLPLRGAGLQAWQQTQGHVTFFSYLFNLEPDAVKAGRHESGYWGNLPDVLRGEGYKINWLHLYVKDELLPDAKRAAQIVDAFNNAGRGEEIHATLDTFVSAHVVREALSDWLKLAWKGSKLQDLIRSSAQDRICLWPLFAEDWRESTCGPTAMGNALHRGLFAAAVSALPKPQIGIYLQENQGWEFALIQTWKSANQGRLIGVPHSSVRFWDLRYHFDPRSYRQNENKPMPLPDQVALNGEGATDAYLAGGYPANNLLKVEALRYLYMDSRNARPILESQGVRHGLRLLVLGDYLASNTRLQMRLLTQAAASLPIGTVITVKPHPASPIHAEDYPGLNLTVVMEPLSNLLAGCDVAYTSAATSAALDAYCAGVPVISVLDSATLNMSPLRGYAGTFYASTPDELILALRDICSGQFVVPTQSNIFTLNRQLPLWRKLLISAS